MKVQITHYSQKGVPLEDDEEEDKGFWKMVVYESVKGAIRLATTPKNEEPYANNMETIIQADIILLNRTNDRHLSHPRCTYRGEPRKIPWHCFKPD